MDQSWQRQAWKADWRGVVDDYWTLCTPIVIAKMCDHEMRKLSNAGVLYRLDPSVVIAREERARRGFVTKDPQYKRRYMRSYKKKNPDKIRAIRHKAKAQPSERIRHNIRRRIRELLGCNPDSFSESTGCTARQLKQYIEAQFTKRMCWNNYGKYWHIDHIQPLASFNLTDSSQRRTACNWANLRPLEARRNMDKADKIEIPQLHLTMSM